MCVFSFGTTTGVNTTVDRSKSFWRNWFWIPSPSTSSSLFDSLVQKKGVRFFGDIESEVVVVMKKNEQYYNATFGAVTMFALLA